MPDRQDRQSTVTWAQGKRQVFDLGAHVGVGELHPFRSACGSRSVNDGAKILWQHGACAFLRGAITRLAFARSLGGQLLQSINSLRRRNLFGRHHDDSLQVGQLRAAMLDTSQHGFVLHKNESGVGMRENINQLRIGDVGAPGHISGSGKKNSVVRKNPLRAVVGEQAHMLTGLQSKGDERCRQIQPAFVGFTEADRHKSARLVLFAKTGKPVVAKRGIRINFRESGSVFEIRHGSCVGGLSKNQGALGWAMSFLIHGS